MNIELKSGAVSDETIRKQLIPEPLLSVCAGAPDLFLRPCQQSEPACKADEPRSYCGGRLAAVVRTLEKNKSADYGGERLKIYFRQKCI